jgi:hypothetical protein
VTTAAIGKKYKHTNSNTYIVRGYIWRTVKDSKDGETHFINARALDKREVFTARRVIHLLKAPFVHEDGLTSLVLPVMLQISKEYPVDMSLEWVIYQGEESHQLFARPRLEFDDGRFSDA